MDTAVYTRNTDRQCRLPFQVNHKFSDATGSVYRLPGCPSVSTSRLASVTCLEHEAWIVPVSASPSLPMTNLALRTMSVARCTTRTSLSVLSEVQTVLSEVQTAEASILSNLLALLRNAGQPDGQLQAKEGDACTFRWATFSLLPCCLAQLWPGAQRTQHMIQTECTSLTIALMRYF